MSADKKGSPGSVPTKSASPSGWLHLDRKRLAVALVLLCGAAGWAVWHFWRDPNQRAIQEALERRDFVEASRLLESSLTANPDNLELRLLAARTARRQGDLRTAIGHLQGCEQRGAASSELDFERRLLRAQKGDPAEVDDMLEACAKSPKAVQSLLMLEVVIEGSLARLLAMYNQEKTGIGEISTSDFTRAQRVVDQWLELRRSQADQVQGHIWRGLLYAVAREHAHSRAAFRQAVALDPEHFRARELLAVLLITEAPQEAASHLETLLQRDRDNENVRLHLARLSRTIGRLNRAEQLLDELLAVNFDQVPVLMERGRVALDRRRPQDAERWLRRAVEKSPDHAEANLLMSECLQQLDRALEAKTYHDRYVEAEAKARAPK